MSYIPLEDHLPGITGLLEYRRDTAEPIRDLTQLLLRGPSSLSEGERELIAVKVSSTNECRFCTTAHSAVADILMENPSVSECVKQDSETAPVSDKMKALLQIAEQVAHGGKQVTEMSIDRARRAGATDIELHDTVLIAALFCLYNRYVDGLATHMPKDSSYFTDLAGRLSDKGYIRRPEVYEALKERNANNQPK